MKNIQRIEAMCEIEKRVSELNDVKGLNQNVGRWKDFNSIESERKAIRLDTFELLVWLCT